MDNFDAVRELPVKLKQDSPVNPSGEPEAARVSGAEPEHMRYLGLLGLLGECSVYVPEDIRELIEQAMLDACAADPGLKYRRILSRLEIEVDFHGGRHG